MKKIIVSTTINPPTEAIEKFDAMPEWQLVMIGDKKTPKDYKLSKGIYVSPEMQEEFDKKLSEAIGWNCIQRRNFGLLWAHKLGADIVALIDDDNIPYDNWGENLAIGKELEVNYYYCDLPAFDPVGATNHKELWHRGYPLQLLSKREYQRHEKRNIHVDVQADFWDGDPDIDAICRMEHAPECKFDRKYFPIAANKMSPFNSQNTFISGELLRHYFLFPHIGRMDDIWASFYVQSQGYNVVYHEPSVYQKRNVHDPIRDMKQEYLGYENNLRLVQELDQDQKYILNYLPERSKIAFELYQEHFK